jgi:putative hemolysin
MRPSGFLRAPLRAHGLMLHKSCGHRVVAVRLHPEEGSSVLYLDLGIVTILIVINGLLAMSELAIVSSRPARLAGLVEKGVRGSRRALALASDPGKFLSTVQIGITLIGVLSGAFSGT